MAIKDRLGGKRPFYERENGVDNGIAVEMLEDSRPGSNIVGCQVGIGK